MLKTKSPILGYLGCEAYANTIGSITDLFLGNFSLCDELGFYIVFTNGNGGGKPF